MLRRVISEVSLAIVALVFGRWVVSDELRPELYGMSIGCLLIILAELIFYAYDHRHFLKLYWSCFRSKKELRLSIAYLYRIEVNGKYLLVKSNRLHDTYQPVGGVYKYFNPEGRRQLEELGMVTDNYIENDEISEYDLRIKLQERRQITAFLQWFINGENREVNPWREFYEELVAPGTLPQEHFGYIHYELVGQDFEPIHFDPFFKLDTLKYADIYRPKFVTPSQEEALRKLVNKSSDDYIWATRDEILQGRSNDNKRIAKHTEKIFITKKLK
jgi:hypothetical protein